MNKKSYLKIRIIGAMGFLAVLIGAFGAHYLKARLSPSSLASFQTGVSYHFYHTLAAFLTVVLSNQFKEVKILYSFWLFIIGIFFFSGSIYLLATKAIHQLEFVKILGPITPLGGILFVLGWLSLLWAFMSPRTKGNKGN